MGGSRAILEGPGSQGQASQGQGGGAETPCYKSRFPLYSEGEGSLLGPVPWISQSVACGFMLLLLGGWDSCVPSQAAQDPSHLWARLLQALFPGASQAMGVQRGHEMWQ